MWEFFEMIWEQLGETFKWFMTGFFGCICLLIILYKNDLLFRGKGLGFIKKVSYYLFLPLFVGVISWFYSTTRLVEKDAKQLAALTIETTQNTLLPSFYDYIISLANEWTEGKVTSKEELVDSYLKNHDYKEGDLTTKGMKWTLVNGLDYIEKTAIDNGELKIDDEEFNFPLLVSNYFSNKDNIATTPFNYLKGFSYKAIRGYTRSFYYFYFSMYFLVFLILLADIYYTLKRRRKLQSERILNPNTTLENNQDKLENSIKELEQKNLLEE